MQITGPDFNGMSVYIMPPLEHRKPEELFFSYIHMESKPLDEVIIFKGKSLETKATVYHFFQSIFYSS